MAPVSLDELLDICGPRHDSDEWHVTHFERADAHHSHGTYIQDPRLQVRWGEEARVAGDDKNHFEAEWSKDLLDSRMSLAWGDIVFNGSVVHRQLYALVDGGRFYVPDPDP